MSFSQRQKILKCLWSKKFELQKCGHTGKIKLWAKFVNHFDVLDNYGVEKSQHLTVRTDRSETALEIMNHYRGFQNFVKIAGSRHIKF